MRLRPPVLDEAAAVLEVVVARDIADLGMPDLTLEDLRSDWTAPGFDLAADAIVAELDNGQIAGYAVIQPAGSLAAVAPSAEGRGIGAALLRWTEMRDRVLGRAHHRQGVAVANERAQALLHGAGYKRVRSYSRMVRPLDKPVLLSAPPAGLRLRPLDAQRDAAALHTLDDLSFQTVPDYRPHSLEEFRAEHIDVHDLAPELSLVAERGADLTGFLVARRWTQERVGYVDLLAVHPDERRRGLGTALLTAAFAGFATDGLHEAQLGVASDNPKALTSYERVGMSERFRVDDLQRQVRQAGIARQ